MAALAGRGYGYDGCGYDFDGCDYDCGGCDDDPVGGGSGCGTEQDDKYISQEYESQATQERPRAGP